MVTETLVSLIVGILGLFISTLIEQKDKKDASIETRNQTFRTDLGKGDVPAVHADLADLHDRVREALRGSPRK